MRSAHDSGVLECRKLTLCALLTALIALCAVLTALMHWLFARICHEILNDNRTTHPRTRENSRELARTCMHRPPPNLNFTMSFFTFSHLSPHLPMGFLMVHPNLTVKNAYFEKPASIYSWVVLTCSQTSINLPMGFLMVHPNSTVKHAYFEEPASIYSRVFLLFCKLRSIYPWFFWWCIQTWL